MNSHYSSNQRLINYNPQPRKKEPEGPLADFRMLDEDSAESNLGFLGALKKGQEKSTGNIYLLKHIPKSLILSSYSVDEFKEEIRRISVLEHPHILKVDKFFEANFSAVLVYEVPQKGNSNS